MIREYYEQERKYDLMPTIRIVAKGKDLEYHKKLLEPLQAQGRYKMPSTVTNKSFNHENAKDLIKFATINDLNSKISDNCRVAPKADAQDNK